MIVDVSTVLDNELAYCDSGNRSSCSIYNSILSSDFYSNHTVREAHVDSSPQEDLIRAQTICIKLSIDGKHDLATTRHF